MVKILVIMIVMIAADLAEAVETRPYYNRSDISFLPDNGRFLLYAPDQSVPDMNITGLVLKQFFLDRSNHTGTQPISSVVNLQATLDNKVDSADPRLSDARTPLAHTQAASTITGLSPVATSGDYNDLANKPNIPGVPRRIFGGHF